jgi:hypothetical protein
MRGEPILSSSWTSATGGGPGARVPHLPASGTSVRGSCASIRYGRSTSRSVAALLQIPNSAAPDFQSSVSKEKASRRVAGPLVSHGKTLERFVGRPSPVRRISRTQTKGETKSVSHLWCAEKKTHSPEKLLLSLV